MIVRFRTHELLTLLFILPESTNRVKCSLPQPAGETHLIAGIKRPNKEGLTE